MSSKKPLSGAARKAKGARRERQCVHDLEAQGYLVTKAGGSLGAFDVIAFRARAGWPEARLVQVKSNRPPGKKEMETLKRLASELGCVVITVELWVYVDGEKTPRITYL